MLQHFKVENFRNLRNVEADFGLLNILIGPNGAGKTSLLSAIDFVRGFFDPEKGVQGYLEDRGWQYSDLPNIRHRDKVIRWNLSVELGPNDLLPSAGRYRYQITLSKRKYLYVGTETLEEIYSDGITVPLLSRRGSIATFANRQTRHEEVSRTLGAGHSAMATLIDNDRWSESYPELLAFRNWVCGFRSYLALDPRTLRSADRGKHTQLGPSGEHLASVVAAMPKTSKQFELMLRRVRRFVPWVTDITVRKGKWGWVELLSREDKHTLNSQQMSEGLLRLLAVTSFLYSEDAPTLLTFEEPENGVHPRLLSELVQIFRDLTNLKPPRRCQVFASTHSPYVLDEFIDTPEEVYLVERGTPEDGARVRRLSEQDNIDLVRETYNQSLGEAWFTGVLGAVPDGGQQ